MAAEKQGPYPPAENPPAYPGPAPGAAPAGYPGAAPGPAPAGYPGEAPGPAPAGYAGPPQAGPYPPQGAYPPPGSYPPGQGPQYQQQYGMPPPGQVAAPPGYAPGQPVVAQPLMGQQVVIMQQQMFRQSPVNTVCPHCQQNIITSTTAEAGGLTWLLCAGICLFGFWLGCCLIPFCIDDCQDIKHTCPNCKNTLHVFKRL